MANFQSFFGIITMFSDFGTGNDQTTGCYKLMSMENPDGIMVNCVVTLENRQSFTEKSYKP